MRPRTGEKVGWTGGWPGGLLWLGILSVVWLAQGKTAEGMTGPGPFAVAVAAACLAAPWRFPRTPYGKLILVPCGLFFGAATFAIHALGGMKQAGLNPFLLFALLPSLTPLFTMGRRRWEDSGGPQDETTR